MNQNIEVLAEAKMGKLLKDIPKESGIGGGRGKKKSQNILKDEEGHFLNINSYM